jgi:hypothetical protein
LPPDRNEENKSSEAVTEAQQQAQQGRIEKGLPIDPAFLWSAGTFIFDLFKRIIESRSTLRARVTQLEGMVQTLAHQNAILAQRVEALESRP